jgi:HAMP domain-containing protein
LSRAFHGSDGDGVMIFAILDLSHEKARHAAELQASERRFASSRTASPATAIRSVTDSPSGRHTATLWDGTPFEYSQDAMDRISDVTGARLTFFSYDAGTGQRSSDPDQCPAGGRASGGRHRRSAPKARQGGLVGVAVLGLFRGSRADHSDDLRTGRVGERPVTGAIAAAVPQGSLAGRRARSSSVLVVVDPVACCGSSVTVAALWWLLRPLAQTTRVLSAMARKDFDDGVPRVRSEDEVGRVARAVAELRNDLAEGARMAAAAEEQEAERERQRLEQVRVSSMI